MNHGDIELKVGDTFYHDLESHSSEWYKKLKLPNKPEQRYYTLYETLKGAAVAVTNTSVSAHDHHNRALIKYCA